MMSVLNPRISHIAIDGALFEAEVSAKQILSVPTVYLNGAEFDAGRLSIEQILSKLDTGAAARAAEAVSYTHLDVYKRQGWGKARGASPATVWAIAAM